MTVVESKSHHLSSAAEPELARRDGVPHKLVRRTGRFPSARRGRRSRPERARPSDLGAQSPPSPFDEH